MGFSIPYKVYRALQVVFAGLREIRSVDYINKLKFDYVELYSFHRGEGYEEEGPHLDGFILNSKNEFHPSAVKTQTFKNTHEKVTLLKDILSRDVVDLAGAMCAPVFRDAIVFYNKKGKIVSTLNVCLGCEYMQLKRAKYILADRKTYDLLSQFFIECGHAVENGDWA